MSGIKNKFVIIIGIIIVVVLFPLCILPVFYPQYQTPFIPRLPFRFWLWLFIFLSGWDIINGLRTGTMYIRSWKGTNKKDTNPKYGSYKTKWTCFRIC